MRISKKFLRGVFNFNHRAYSSSVAPSPPPPQRCIKGKWSSEAPDVTAHTRVTETRCSSRACFLRTLWEVPRTRARGLRVCRSAGHTIFPFSLGPIPALKNLSGVLERVIYYPERCPGWTRSWKRRVMLSFFLTYPL